MEVSINTWLAPTYKLDYSPELTEEIYATMKPILEEWSGEATGLVGHGPGRAALLGGAIRQGGCILG